MNIPEGLCFRQLPSRFGAGRILSNEAIRERYATLRLFGWRLFVACGFYSDRLGVRYWILKDNGQ